MALWLGQGHMLANFTRQLVFNVIDQNQIESDLLKWRIENPAIIIKEIKIVNEILLRYAEPPEPRVIRFILGIDEGPKLERKSTKTTWVVNYEVKEETI